MIVYCILVCLCLIVQDCHLCWSVCFYCCLSELYDVSVVVSVDVVIDVSIVEIVAYFLPPL